MTREEKRDRFIERVNGLYAQIEDICSELGLHLRRVSTTINEEAINAYDIDTVIIEQDEKEIFRIIPIGAWIIGADGAVDFKGMRGKERLIYLEKAPAVPS